MDGEAVVTTAYRRQTCDLWSWYLWDEEQQLCLVTLSADLDLNGCVGAPDLLELLAQFGECVEQATSTCEGPVEYQGYDYQTVMIGGQCWFAENLRSVNYRNGDLIQGDLNDNEWNTTQNGATAWCQQTSAHKAADLPFQTTKVNVFPAR